jgi:IS4 transposase
MRILYDIYGMCIGHLIGQTFMKTSMKQKYVSYTEVGFANRTRTQRSIICLSDLYKRMLQIELTFVFS